MKKITSNNGINKLITHINGECSFDERESNRIKKMIKDDPSSSDIYILRDYIYKKLLNSGKSILELEKVLSNEDMKKRERILNTYKTILNGDFNFALARWAYLLDLTDESNTFYDFIKNMGIYADIENRNVFFKQLNEFVMEENFDFNSYGILMARKENPYPPTQKIISNYKSMRYKGKKYTKELGVYGELCSHLFVKQELSKNGREDLSKRTIWVARDIGDYFGFDEYSFEDNGDETILEVKATNSPKFVEEKDNFYMTRHEFEKMKELSKDSNYYVVRAYINDQGHAELYFLKPNKDNSVEYGDIKYVPTKTKSGDQLEYKRESKKKIFKPY